MARSKKLANNKPSKKVSNNSPRSLKFYLSSSRYSKMVGRFTTNSYFKLKDILNTEVEIPKVHKKSNLKHAVSKSPSETGKVKRPDLNPNHNHRHEKDFELGPLAQGNNGNGDKQSIKHVVKLSNEVLASATTVFPIDLFPDSIVLDRTTLNITKRTFFFSNDTISIRIEDILNAKVSVGPFLGTLTIASRVMSTEDHFTISNLRRKDAIHFKHMIHGYVIALHNELDIAHLSREELCQTITELGHDANN